MAHKSIQERVNEIESRVGSGHQRSFGEELVDNRAIFNRLTVEAADGVAQQARNSADGIRNFGSRTETTWVARGWVGHGRANLERSMAESEQQAVQGTEIRTSLSVQERTDQAVQHQGQQSRQVQQEQTQQQEQSLGKEA